MREMVQAGLSAAALLVASPAVAQAQWQHVIGRAGDEYASWTIECANGDFVDCGAHATFGPFITRRDAGGVVQWTQQYADASWTYRFDRVQELANGDFIASGEARTAGGTVGSGLVRLTSAGTVLWARAYPGSIDPVAVDEVPGAGFIVAATRNPSPNAIHDGVLMRIDATGAPLWMWTYTDSRYGTNTALEFRDVHAVTDAGGAPDGFIACGATSDFLQSNQDSLLVRVANDGSILWAKTYGHVLAYDWAEGCEPAANGDFLMCGYTKAPGEGGGSYLLRTDASGTLLWHDTFRHYYATASMHEGPTGAIVMAGNALDFLTFDQPALLETDPGGVVTFCMAYGTISSGFGRSVAVRASGGYQLLSHAPFNTFGGREHYSVATDAAGVSGCDEAPWDPVPVDLVPPVITVALPRTDILAVTIVPLHSDSSVCEVDVLCPEPCTGDLNDDGFVTFEDLVALLAQWGGSGTGDLDGSGAVDFTDLVTLLTVFGQAC